MDIEKTKTNPPREKLLHLWNSVHGIVSNFQDGDSKLAEEHERRIRQHYNQLLSTLNVPGVVTQMFKSGKLTLKEHEHLRQFHSTPVRASEELLNIIIINSQDVYECFLESLKKTKQHHVHQMLTSNEEIMCIDDQSMSGHSRIIRNNYDWLIEKLELDSGLLATLYAKEVLTKREYSHILFEKEQFVKTENFLSIISRKSVEEFGNFKIALNENLQGHVTERLAKTPVGDETQSDPKKEPPTTPSSKQMVTKPVPKINPSKPNRMEKPENVTKHKIVRMQSVEYLEAKLKQLPNELQTEISTKMFLIHRSKSTASRPIWAISITKILEESRSIKTQNMVQAQAADEKWDRLMQEIIGTKKQLEEKQEIIDDLEDRFNFTKYENKNLLEKLKDNEFKVGNLTALNQQKEQEVGEKESKIEELKSQITNNEINLKETKAQLKDTKYKLTENYETLKQTLPKLEEAQWVLKETQAKKNELEAKLKVAEKGIDDLTVMNQRKEQEVDEKVRVIEILHNQIMQSEEQLKQMKTQIESTEEKFKEYQLYLESTTEKLMETQEKLKEMETKQSESEAKLKATEKGSDNSKSEEPIEYKVEPHETIETLASQGPKNLGVCGMAVLDKELFVISDSQPEIEVYDMETFKYSRTIQLYWVIDPGDIAACHKNKRIYIVDWTGRNLENKMLRLDTNGKEDKERLSLTDDECRLFVTRDSNILVTFYRSRKIVEFTPDWNMVFETKIRDTTIHPIHSVKLSNGFFAICHGKKDESTHTVCIVDDYGNLLKSFGGRKGAGVGQVNFPTYLAVDRSDNILVADRDNGRVLVLDSSLECKAELLSKKDELRRPRALLLDETNSRLVVADCNEKLKDGRILIFNIGLRQTYYVTDVFRTARNHTQ